MRPNLIIIEQAFVLEGGGLYRTVMWDCIQLGGRHALQCKGRG